MNIPIPSLDTERLTALVFELSSQLHAERLHRIALETALSRAGVIDPGAVQGLVTDPAVRDLGQRAVEESVAKLMRVLTESGDVRAPLRGGG